MTAIWTNHEPQTQESGDALKLSDEAAMWWAAKAAGLEKADYRAWCKISGFVKTQDRLPRFVRWCICGLLVIAMPAVAQSPFAAKPYMGWSSWSLLRSQVTEAAVLAQADALKANHLDVLGYLYINVDDGWSDGWDDDALSRVNKEAFPHGMASLARQIHQRGLLFGLYLNCGIRRELYDENPLIAGTKIHVREIADTKHPGSTRDPAFALDDPKYQAYRIDFSKPGAQEFIQAQVNQLAQWGVDLLKLDFVGPGGGNVASDNREEVRAWHRAIQRSKHPIWFELSNRLSANQAPLWRETANGWRVDKDIECYVCKKIPARSDNLTEWTNVAARFTDIRPWVHFAGPRGWNDLDSLELGNGDRDGLTRDERQTMLVFWAISCSPLYLGTDLTHMDSADMALLANPRIIAINQAGVPAVPVDLPTLREHENVQVWGIQRKDGSLILGVFNLGEKPANIQLSLAEIDAVLNMHLSHEQAAMASNVITGVPMTIHGGELTLQVNSHGSELLQLKNTRGRL